QLSRAPCQLPAARAASPLETCVLRGAAGATGGGLEPLEHARKRDAKGSERAARRRMDWRFNFSSPEGERSRRGECEARLIFFWISPWTRRAPARSPGGAASLSR